MPAHGGATLLVIILSTKRSFLTARPPRAPPPSDNLLQSKQFSPLPNAGAPTPFFIASPAKGRHNAGRSLFGDSDFLRIFAMALFPRFACSNAKKRQTLLQSPCRQIVNSQCVNYAAAETSDYFSFVPRWATGNQRGGRGVFCISACDAPIGVSAVGHGGHGCYRW